MFHAPTLHFSSTLEAIRSDTQPSPVRFRLLLLPGASVSSSLFSGQCGTKMPTGPYDFDIDRYISRIVPRSRLHILPKPISRFLGYRSTPAPPTGNILIWCWSFIGAFCGILIVEAVFETKHFQAQGVPPVVASLVCLPLQRPLQRISY